MEKKTCRVCGEEVENYKVLVEKYEYEDDDGCLCEEEEQYIICETCYNKEKDELLKILLSKIERLEESYWLLDHYVNELEDAIEELENNQLKTKGGK